MPLPPVAVFDLDGTLVDTAPDLTASLNVCLRAAGLPAMALADVRPHAGHGSRVMLEAGYSLAGRAWEDGELAAQTERFLAHYADHIADESRPFPGVVEAMDRLADGGYTLAVCTNKTERLSRLLLEALGLGGRFAAICGADTVARRKPDPIHLLGTIERAGGGPDAAVMIGDTATDTAAALAAGVPSILVDFGYTPDPEARRAATEILSDFRALDAALVDRLIADARSAGRRPSLSGSPAVGGASDGD